MPFFNKCRNAKQEFRRIYKEGDNHSLAHRYVSTPRPIRTPLTRTGCWTCRRRGYRCDEERPACKMCQRLSISCDGYGVRLKWQDSMQARKGRKTLESTPRTDASLFHTQPATPAPAFPLLPGQHTETDVFLLQHYFFTISSLLSSTPDRTVNTYLSTVLPLMLEHDFLLKIVLALSAVHLSSRFPDQFTVYADKLKGCGMRGLIDRLGCDKTRRDNYPQVSASLSSELWDEGVLATIIMLGILEVFEANACLWSRHLEGAASFLATYLERSSSIQPTQHDMPTSRKLLEIYAYHEVLASIALGRVPRLPSSFMRRIPAPDEATVCVGTDAVQWSAYATRPEKRSVFLSAVDSLLSLVAELATIRSSSGHNDRLAQESAAHIVVELRRWQCPDVQYSVETRNTAEAMRQAGVLFYYLTWGENNTSYEALSAVDTIVQCLQVIPVQHSAVASHVWPLYMAGLAATHKHQRVSILQRLEEMVAVRGIRSIVQVRDTLTDIWKHRQGDSVRSVRFNNTSMGLVLF